MMTMEATETMMTMETTAMMTMETTAMMTMETTAMMTMETTAMMDTTMITMYSTAQMMARNTPTQWVEFFVQKVQAKYPHALMVSHVYVSMSMVHALTVMTIGAMRITTDMMTMVTVKQ